VNSGQQQVNAGGGNIAGMKAAGQAVEPERTR
jgi:hypothetical protein